MTELEFVSRMALSQAYEILGNAVYDAAGVIQSANIHWADEIPGEIRNVTSDKFGIDSMEITRGNSKYVILTFTRDAQGFITETSINAIGFTE